MATNIIRCARQRFLLAPGPFSLYQAAGRLFNNGVEMNIYMSRFRRYVVLVTILSTMLPGCSSKQSQQNFALDTAAQVQTANGDSLVIELTGVDSLNVLELLKREHEVEYRGTAAGAFVTAIGPTATCAEYFWLFSINDTFPTVACDRCVVSANDRVRWHFRRVGR